MMEDLQENGNIQDHALWKVIAKVMTAMEQDENIMVLSSSNVSVINRIYEAVVTTVPRSDLSDVELHGVRSLVLEAIEDKRFFDWEMPTLTGFSAEQFKTIALKLPKE